MPRRCLIVEDQVMFLQLLCKMLQGLDGLEVVATASTCHGALEACRLHRPDALILDLALPDGDGLSVARFLRMLQPQAKALVLSAQASSFVCPEDLEPMLVAVVDKTSTYETLQGVLETALLESRGDQPAPLPGVKGLTPRQREIFTLIGRGLANKVIAHSTGLSLATVETHRKAIARRLGCSGAELVRRAALHLEQMP
ncbi:response regulator transcription factor [Cyanobium sp. T1B-Tous]|uniref:response regulator transcription factor n=1 Tax=Cyanobium sp. T1B-Tous TaxID=2823721 RepID=UPI0020CCE1D2|nr:response regulator transcription factor [Cyanobium sp. T1B-Tous]